MWKVLQRDVRWLVVTKDAHKVKALGGVRSCNHRVCLAKDRRRLKTEWDPDACTRVYPKVSGLSR
jgi:hypothetical protein